MSEDNACLNCGHNAGAENPPNPSHCGGCPPWRCDQCGEMCSMSNTCSCWVDLTGMALADIKALFAVCDSELSIDPIISSAP